MAGRRRQRLQETHLCLPLPERVEPDRPDHLVVPDLRPPTAVGALCGDKHFQTPAPPPLRKTAGVLQEEEEEQNTQPGPPSDPPFTLTFQLTKTHLKHLKTQKLLQQRRNLESLFLPVMKGFDLVGHFVPDKNKEVTQPTTAKHTNTCGDESAEAPGLSGVRSET